jgi:hypothetical protein
MVRTASQRPRHRGPAAACHRPNRRCCRRRRSGDCISERRRPDCHRTSAYEGPPSSGTLPLRITLRSRRRPEGRRPSLRCPVRGWAEGDVARGISAWRRGSRGPSSNLARCPWRWQPLRICILALPALGALAFVCEWPSEGVSLSRVEIDASLIREAAEKAKELWEDEGRSAGGGWTSREGQTP